MAELIVVLLVGVIESGLVVYKYYVNSIGRNPACGGLFSYLPTCPLTGVLTQVYQQEGESCTLTSACEPGLICNKTCQRPNQPLPSGRRSEFLFLREPPLRPIDTAQWCTLDSDCRGYFPVDPTSDARQSTALCVNGRCRPANVRYSTILNFDYQNSCNLLSCPLGVCICLDRDTMTVPYGNLFLNTGAPRIRNFPEGPSIGITHPPFGLSPRSVLNTVIGFNSEQLQPNPDRNAKKMTTYMIICFVLLGISLLALFLSSNATGMKKVILIGVVIVLQVLFFVVLFSRWS